MMTGEQTGLLTHIAATESVTLLLQFGWHNFVREFFETRIAAQRSE
jgi:hypothetical protein